MKDDHIKHNPDSTFLDGYVIGRMEAPKSINPHKDVIKRFLWSIGWSVGNGLITKSDRKKHDNY